MAFESFLLGIFIFIAIVFAICIGLGIYAFVVYRGIRKQQEKISNNFNEIFNDKFFKG